MGLRKILSRFVKPENTGMTKTDAIIAMEQGKKITHRDFTPDEWMTMRKGKIVLEDGVQCTPIEFWRWRTGSSWDDGYSLYEK